MRNTWKKFTSRIRRAFKRSNKKELFIDLLIAFFVIGVVVTGALFIWIATLDIPDLDAFENRKVLQSTKIYDRTGEVLLYDLHQDIRRTIVPFEEISQNVKDATVAIEDDDFYNHIGVDIKAIFRAALSNLSEGDLLGGQGGSTITQQVIKNSVLETDKKLTRKIKEAILAIRLEQVFTKDEILYYYLNESPYGGTIYGVQEASQAFFGKDAKDVTLAEAAYLAALPQAPTYLSPYGNNRQALEDRKNLVLKRMQLNGYISQEEYDQARGETVEFQPQSVSGIKAPHFVMYIREQLVEKYGEEALAERGFKVTTSLDWELQQKAEEIVKRKALENATKYNASNAGLVAVDPQNGDVLVMVGSRDYFDEEIDGNFNVATANRQPGSSIKPIVYASAFSKGYTPDTIVYDVPTQFSAACEPWDSGGGDCYAPQNYNHQFVGPIKLRNALPQSLNIPAVKVLYLAGIRGAIKTATDMGITTLNDPDRLGLTLVLGGGEVKLLEHTGAYGVFANEGVRAERRAILKIEDFSGNILEEPEVKETQALDREVALQISDILSDKVARAPLWGNFAAVQFSQDVALKSGSTNDLRDAWIMGYTPNLAVGVWVGNNDNAVMGGGLSGLIATPMWREFMDVALPKRDVESFPEPAATDPTIKPILRGVYLDSQSVINNFLQNVQSGGDDVSLNTDNLTGGVHSILYYVDRNNPRGPYPTNPSDDPQFRLWEYGVQNWGKTYYQNILTDLQTQLQQQLQEQTDQEAETPGNNDTEEEEEDT